MAIQLADNGTLAQKLKESDIALVDFTADWCPPCRALAPILEELSEEMSDKLSIIKIDTDQSPDVATAYGVMSMPTVIVFKNGQPVDKLVGLRPKGVYMNIIDKLLQ